MASKKSAGWKLFRAPLGATIDPENITDDVLDMFEDVKGGMKVDEAIMKWLKKF